ncbi:MAG: hypothetical protein M4D80_09240 [Myxococcota bacterium]|nr:hypothetical protein [Deltaproteobacteria bacterium]MDQ3335336.1 hypothetical protein [Myxococcota bacterium]
MRLAILALVLACNSGTLVALDPPPPRDAAAIDVLAAQDFALAADCPASVMGRPFRGARMLCLAAVAMALTSSALDRPSPRIAAQLEALVEVALAADARAPFAALPASVLYRGLLGLMLAALHHITAPAVRWTTMFDELAAALAHDLERGWLPSYRDDTWPCDHAPAASFLRLHGTLRDSATSTRAADALLGRLRALLPAFPTRIGDKTVRTTALAFAASYLLPADPALARAFAEQVVRRCDRHPIAACREWSERGHRADVASGPLVGDYAVGATALAIIATRALPDPDWNTALLATASLAASPADGTLEAALLAWGRTARAF